MWTPRLIHGLVAVAALAVPGCAQDTDLASPAGRTPTGKADAPGSCQSDERDFCGGGSPDGCFCDDQCDGFGDCCSDVGTVCRGEEPDDSLPLGGGTWSETERAPLHFIHGALLFTGKVVIFAGLYNDETDQSYAIWDPQTGGFTTHDLPDDLLCSHHTQLPNGDILLMGGGGGSPNDQKSWALLLNAVTEEMEHIAPMSTTRWYPTAIPLADGRALVGGGHFTGFGLTDTLEIFDPQTAAWTDVEGSQRDWSAWYPALKLLPNGDVISPFALGFLQNGLQPQGTRILRLDGEDGGRWEVTPDLEFPNREEGSSAIVIDDSGERPNATVMVMGGGLERGGEIDGRANLSSVEILDVGDGSETRPWRRGADMLSPRSNVTALVLPTGRVMAIGGRLGPQRGLDHAPVLASEVYDFEEDRWELTGEFTSIAAQYHNVSMLLPDGRVFSGGGNNPTLGTIGSQRNQRDFEIYTPAYMEVERPTIVAAPEAVTYGERFEIKVETTADIDAVAMISLASITHHTDAGGRYVKLAHEVAEDGTITVRGPTDGNVMPPGFVMLFALHEDVPSPAAILRVGEL